MIREDVIKSELFGGVGWRDSTLTGIPSLSSNNLLSASGLRFEGVSDHVSLNVVYDTQENKDITDDQFNILLENMQYDCISDVCRKITSEETSHIQSLNLYPYEKLFSNTLSLEDKFYCLRIERPLSPRVVLRISAIELSFDSDVTFNVYLFNSNKKEPIKTQSVTCSAGESIIQKLDWYIADTSEFKGGKFYLGYFQKDLSGALPYEKNYELASYKQNILGHWIEPLSIDHANEVLDISTDVVLSDPHGINIVLDVYNDYTELLTRNKNLIWPAIQLQMGERVLNMIKTSTRSNRIQRVTDKETYFNEINFILYGNTARGIQGIVGKLESIIKDIKKTLFYKPRIRRITRL